MSRPRRVRAFVAGLVLGGGVVLAVGLWADSRDGLPELSPEARQVIKQTFVPPTVIKVSDPKLMLDLRTVTIERDEVRRELESKVRLVAVLQGRLDSAPAEVVRVEGPARIVEIPANCPDYAITDIAIGGTCRTEHIPGGARMFWSGTCAASDSFGATWEAERGPEAVEDLTFFEAVEAKPGWKWSVRAGLHSDRGLDLGASRRLWRRFAVYGGWQSGNRDQFIPDEYGEVFSVETVTDSRLYGGLEVRW